jgi:nitronate monooxygenase
MGVQVTTPDGAKRALDCGADFLVCQGVEAGGHVQATQPLALVLPQVISEARSVPVVAAGGIGSGIAMAAVLRMGAAAAMFGTRFVASDESLAHASYKKRLVESSAQNASLTLCFDLGWPYAAHRVLRNDTLDTWEAAGCPPSGFRPGEGDTVATLPNGKVFKRYEDAPALLDMQGSVLDLCLYAGLSVAEINEIRPAAELVDTLWAECKLALSDTESN